MNVTELARRLRITPQELRSKLPLLGFDIGGKAIKIDNATAQKIIQNWPRLMEKMREKEQLENESSVAKDVVMRTVEIPQYITVRDFAAIAVLPVSKVIAELMKNSIFVSLNEDIDFDTAAIIGSDLGLEIKLAERKEDDKEASRNIIEEEIQKQSEEELVARPPVIVVMGHVDHGKTKLLDAIRRTSVAEGEAGGITQHIGAYQVVRRNRLITFIDTPGHEAFTAMRGRGAKVADIAILVVAADDGVKPQTVEAYRIIESAKIPFIVAINKVDKPEANIDKTKQELSSQLGILPEDWGGKIICAPVSAKEGTGVEEILDMVLLTADMEAGSIRANPASQAVGTIVESRIDKGEGAVATILVQNGTLRVGDKLVLGNTLIGRVRALKNYRGEKIDEAPPSTPAKIIGLKVAPEVGDIIRVGEGEAMDMKKFQTKKARHEMQKDQGHSEEKSAKKINLIIKSDVLGSGEAIQESLEKINTAEVKADIIFKGLGNITDGDIRRAEASQALIVGFNVKVPAQLEEMIREKRVEIKQYNIIYDLIDEVKKRMEDLLEPEITRKDLGKLKVAAIFKTEKSGQIIGGKVIEGKIEPDSQAEVFRNKEIITTGKITMLKSGKQDVTVVQEPGECGAQFEGEPIIIAGDIINVYKEEKTVKKL
jgi:translation initiation factor IF-2